MADADRSSLSVRFARRILAAFRALVRRDEIGLIGLGVISGGMAGLFVSAILASANYLHLRLFGHPHLSSITALQFELQALVPMIGGLILGISAIFIEARRPRRPVDPIEANALRGGRMSFRDSLLITAQTVVSNGFGASVGLEAAYAQIGSGFASRLGSLFNLRRGDMRTLVGCGSAGAIGAAFGAPITGAFYAFELILGAYTPFGLAPVGVAAIAGLLVSRALGVDGQFGAEVGASNLSDSDAALMLPLGAVCALFGIVLMQAVSLVEAVFRWSRLPRALQPGFGGLVIGALALISPAVLGSGHRALYDLFDEGPRLVDALLLTLALKSIGSAVSIGAGFRGGLFFASLFLGGTIGQVYAAAMGAWDPQFAPDLWVCTIVGMAALSVAVVGGPLTMTFLALESTRDFRLSFVMLAVAAIVSVIVRRFFGYSFATWRLHLRGESIRSAQDVSWMRTLTVGRMMRTDVPLARSDATIDQFIEEFPLGSTMWVVVVDPFGRYAGMVFVPDAHLVNRDGEAAEVHLAEVARLPDVFLSPEMNIKMAAQIFEQSESEALAVVDGEVDRLVIGLLTEAHLLRRYTEELDQARRELSGDVWT